jgi:hypothetical protein
MIGDGEGEMERSLRVWVFLFVVVDFEAIQDDSCVLWYVHPVVHKVLGREVWRSQPERRVGALHLEKSEAKLPRFELGRGLGDNTTYLLDDGTNIRKTLLVFHTRPIVSVNHLVEFSVRSSLDFWM